MDYSQLSVPEEGGIRFTRITDDADNLWPLDVSATSRSLRFPALRTFDVSPDHDRIAFLANRNDKLNIYVRATQQSSATTQRTFVDAAIDPTFSADGDRIAFADLRSARLNVYSVSARSGSAIRQETNSREASDAPAYSPDSTRMAYVETEASAVGSETVARYYVWEYDLRTNTYTQFSEGYSPAYSPDGTQLAVVRTSRDHGNSEIWIVDLTTGTETLVLSDAETAYAFPAFSPSGERLVLTGVTAPERQRRRNLDLYTVGTDGTRLTQLTFHPGHDYGARFGRDDREIYFASMRGSSSGRHNLWRMTLR